MSASRVVLSSRNKKKIGEIRELVDPWGIELVGVDQFPEVGEVDETGSTFAENACLKASLVAKQTNQWVLAEDSGLCVLALGDAPGIYSARYAGLPANDSRNNEKLLADLENVPIPKRTAYYVCSAVLCDPSGVARATAEGRCYGRMLTSEELDRHAGTNGFGYDPYFLVPEYHRTFGELPAVVKRHISHRAKAFERLIPQMAKLLTR